MNILIANPGSTSYKCKFYRAEDMTVLFQASVERIGDAEGIVTHSFAHEEKKTVRLAIPDYYAAVNLTIEALKERYAVTDIAAVGFKTVHAKNVTGCVELTSGVLEAMEEYRGLA
ncbi:MAG TPA: hypothetical protein VK470_13815, partial [Bacteroidota bacterium]|nr:hypothetical protein [Bacteroidota bacterium]